MCACVVAWYVARVALTLDTDGVLLFVALSGLFVAHSFVEYDWWWERTRDARMQTTFERAQSDGATDDEAFAVAQSSERRSLPSNSVIAMFLAGLVVGALCGWWWFLGRR